MASGIYLRQWIRLFDTNSEVIDMANDTIGHAIFLNTYTADFTTNATNGDYLWSHTANEHGSTGSYTTGGNAAETLGTPGVSEAVANNLCFTGADPSYTAADFANARHSVMYDNTIATAANARLICGLDYGSDATTSNGTLTIDLPTNGFIQIPNV